MKVLIGTGNRITLPKQFCKENDLKSGVEYEIDCINGILLLTPLVKSDNNVETKQIKTISKTDVPVVFSNSKKYKTNLEESKNYRDRRFSKCGYIVRTKTRYLKKLCSECRGQLFDRSCRFNLCPYSKKEEFFDIDKEQEKATVENIKQNVNKIISKSIIINNMEISDDTVIQPKTYNHHHQCFVCEEYVDRGFLMDDKFCCKKCAVNQFKTYLNIRNEGK